MASLTLDDINQLSPRERLALIGQLWDSLAEAEVPLSGAQRAELENRLTGFEEEQQQGVAWEDLKAELASRAP